MNKLNILVVGLVAFAMVAQLVCAGKEELVNELDENLEIDDEPEGGFMDEFRPHQSASRFAIKHNTQTEYGNDIQLNGQTKLVEDRTSPCSKSKTKAECENCCKTQEAGANGRFTAAAYYRNKVPLVPKKDTCVCYSASTAYVNPGLA